MQPRSSPDPDLVAIDDALLRLRRFLQTPMSVTDAGQDVELSTLLVVGVVAAAPDRSASVGLIAGALDVAPSTASRLVARAEANGMIARAGGGPDGRTVALRLTPLGSALNERAQAFRFDRLRTALAGFTAGQRRQFAELLARFADGATGHRPDDPSD